MAGERLGNGLRRRFKLESLSRKRCVYIGMDYEGICIGRRLEIGRQIIRLELLKHKDISISNHSFGRES